MHYDLQLPLTSSDIEKLCIGDTVTLTGELFTARDAAHKKIVTALDNGEQLPFSLQNACIYYAGPCPAAPGEVIGPCGPTTSYRMDAYAPRLIDCGVNAMIGKGKRSDDVKSAMKNRAVYFAAIGGAAVLIANTVKTAEIVAFPELGAEAVRRLTVEKFPAVVASDAFCCDLYQ